MVYVGLVTQLYRLRSKRIKLYNYIDLNPSEFLSAIRPNLILHFVCLENFIVALKGEHVFHAQAHENQHKSQPQPKANTRPENGSKHALNLTMSNRGKPTALGLQDSQRNAAAVNTQVFVEINFKQVNACSRTCIESRSSDSRQGRVVLNRVK